MKVTQSTGKENTNMLLSVTRKELRVTARMKVLTPYCSQTERQSISSQVRIVLYFSAGPEILCFFRPSSWVLMILGCSILLTGNYHEALSDAKSARVFQPTYMKAIERGKV